MPENTLDAHGLGHSGTYRTQPERQTPHIMNVGGVRVAHLAWTFGLNGIPQPAGRAWAVNVFDPRVPTVEGMLADETTQATNDSVITRFTFTRGTDNHFTVTAAEAIPTRVQHTNHGVVVVPTMPGDASYRRVAQVLERRGAVNAGLVIVGQ